jgi:tripartite-type tricarboxylate transporter receptor subunit TctC
MPDVPTFTEEGLPFVYDSWFGLLAPAGIPAPIVHKISQEWAAALQTPEMQAKLKSQFVIGASDTPEAFDKIIGDETAQLTAVFKETNIAQ